MIQNYKIVTLCGSTRFKEQFLEAQKRLTLEGCIVISVGPNYLWGIPKEIEQAIIPFLTEEMKKIVEAFYKHIS